MKKLKYIQKHSYPTGPNLGFVEGVINFNGHIGLDTVSPSMREAFIGVAAVNKFLFKGNKSILVFDQKNIDSILEDMSSILTTKGMSYCMRNPDSDVVIANKADLIAASKMDDFHKRDVYLATNTIPASNKEFSKILELLSKAKSSVVSFQERSSVDAMFFLLKVTNQYSGDFSDFTRKYTKYDGPIIKGKRPFMLRELRVKPEFGKKFESMLEPFYVADRGKVKKTKLRL